MVCFQIRNVFFFAELESPNKDGRTTFNLQPHETNNFERNEAHKLNWIENESENENENEPLTPSIEKCRVQGRDDNDDEEFFPVRNEASTAVGQSLVVATAREWSGDVASGVCHLGVFAVVVASIALSDVLAGWTVQTASVSQTLWFHTNIETAAGRCCAVLCSKGFEWN